ncbi:MAG: phosphate signaling complex protein PhoU [Pirellulales bacterium]|nr:phosphate signaling complex protein PhoU [Pirellulales bacterium]
MPIHLQRDIDFLKKQVLSLCAIVEDQVRLAVGSVLERDAAMARHVQDRDTEVDQREVEVEEKCLAMLALHQPLASDLRLIVSVVKINNDLERIGDLAVNIARKAAALCEEPPIDIPFDLKGMWEKCQSMLHDSIDAMVRFEPQLAHDVCGRDDAVDRMKHDIRVQLEEMMRRDPDRIRPLERLRAVTRNLERIADCATNIAEDVIYITEGRIIRHREGD